MEFNMSRKEKRLPINSVGKVIKEAREKRGLSIEELAWKINDSKITPKLIMNWEKGNEFPDLDSIYSLSKHLKLNPNELLKKRITIQDESIHEINPATKRVSEKFFHAFYVVVRQSVKLIAGICIIVVAANYKQFENMMSDPNDPKQMQLVERVIDNAVDDFTEYRVKPKNNEVELMQKNNILNNTLQNNITTDITNQNEVNNNSIIQN